MLNTLTTLAVAKAKAVGLVAGTAMVTTALVGGGAVAMTVVSNEEAQHGSATAAEASAADELRQDAENRSDTATAVIGDLPVDAPGEGADEDNGCGEEVSAVAQSRDASATGREHGEAVSAAALACSGAEEAAETAETEETQRGKSAEAKANRAGKPEQAEDAGKPAVTGESAGKGQADDAGRPETAGAQSETAGSQADSAGSQSETAGSQADENDGARQDGDHRPAGAGSAGQGGGRG